MADDGRRGRGHTGAAPPWRDDVRMLLAIVTVIAAMGGLGLYLDNRITSVDGSLRGEMREIKADIRQIDAALRDLNTRVGRIEGALGVSAPVPAE